MFCFRWFFRLIFCCSILFSVTACDGDGIGVLYTNATEVNTIVVLPENIDSRVGQTVQLTAIGYDSSGSSQDITKLAIWSSVDETVAKVNSTTGLITAVSVGNTVIEVKYGAVTTNIAISVYDDDNSIFEIKINTQDVYVDQKSELTLTKVFEDSSKVETIPNDEVSWLKNDPLELISEISDRVFHGIKEGDGVEIQAFYKGTKYTKSTDVKGIVSVEISEEKVSLHVGSERQLDLLNKSNGVVVSKIRNEAVNWSSSDSNIADVDESGLILAKSTGVVDIYSEYKGSMYNSEVTVLGNIDLGTLDIKLKPSQRTNSCGRGSALEVGRPVELGLFSIQNEIDIEITDNVRWAVEDETNARFFDSSVGLITPLSFGRSRVFATYNGFTVTQIFSVHEMTGIESSNRSDEIYVNSVLQFDVTAQMKDESGGGYTCEITDDDVDLNIKSALSDGAEVKITDNGKVLIKSTSIPYESRNNSDQLIDVTYNVGGVIRGQAAVSGYINNGFESRVSKKVYYIPRLLGQFHQDRPTRIKDISFCGSDYGVVTGEFVSAINEVKSALGDDAVTNSSEVWPVVSGNIHDAWFEQASHSDMTSKTINIFGVEEQPNINVNTQEKRYLLCVKQ